MKKTAKGEGVGVAEVEKSEKLPTVTPEFDPTPHLIDLKGKAYLPVAARLLWFKQKYFDLGWSIRSSVCMGATLAGKEGALFICHIIDDKNAVRASGHAYLEPKNFARFVEKAETAAMGRALAVCGIGTQFAVEMDEETDKGELADSPQDKEPATFFCARCLKTNKEVTITPEQNAGTVEEFGFALCPPCTLAGREAKAKAEYDRVKAEEEKTSA